MLCGWCGEDDGIYDFVADLELLHLAVSGEWQPVQVFEDGSIVTVPILGDDSPCKLLGFLKFIDKCGRMRVPYCATSLHFCGMCVWLEVWPGIAYDEGGQSGIWQLWLH